MGGARQVALIVFCFAGKRLLSEPLADSSVSGEDLSER